MKNILKFGTIIILVILLFNCGKDSSNEYKELVESVQQKLAEGNEFEKQRLLNEYMNAKITRENYKELVENIEKNASEEEFKKVEAVIYVSKMVSVEGEDYMDRLEGKSFNELIKNFQKISEHEQQRKEEKLKHNDELKKLLASFLETESWFKINQQDELDDAPKIIINASIKNKSGKDIEAFAGTIHVYDRFKNQVSSLDIINMRDIKNGTYENFKWEFSTSYDDKNIHKIYNTPSKDLSFEFEVKHVEFTDGVIVTLL